MSMSMTPEGAADYEPLQRKEKGTMMGNELSL